MTTVVHGTWKKFNHTRLSPKKYIFVSYYSTAVVQLHDIEKLQSAPDSTEKKLFLAAILIVTDFFYSYSTTYYSTPVQETIVRYYVIFNEKAVDQYKKPSAQKKVAPNVGSLKSNQIRKWCPSYIKKKIAPDQDGNGNCVPLSDLIIFQAANIWGKLFLSRRLFIQNLHPLH